MNVFTEYRVKARLRQSEAAEKIGVRQSTISEWETGKKLPKIENLLKIAEVYNCDAVELAKKTIEENSCTDKIKVS